MNADVSINVSITAKQRFDNEPFRPTRTGTENFHLSTQLDSYETALPAFAHTVYLYVTQLRLAGAETGAHIAIRIDNVTHPVPAKGVVPLPKGYRDLALTGEELSSEEVLVKTISDALLALRKDTKY